MDAFDFQEEKQRKSVKKPPTGIIFNLLTVLVLVLTLCLIGFFALTYINPNNPFNPFPPDPTNTPWLSPTNRPTRTSTPITPVPTSTSTSPPTQTRTVTLTPTEITPIFTFETTPTNTPEPTEEPPADGILFIVQSGTPKYLDSTIFNPALGCNFMGVAGQVFDNSGTPMLGVIVEISGTLNGEDVLLITTTGGATQYGPGGFEFNLADAPSASDGTLSIRLKDVDGNAISESIPLTTSDNCEENLVMINFVER